MVDRMFTSTGWAGGSFENRKEEIPEFGAEGAEQEGEALWKSRE